MLLYIHINVWLKAAMKGDQELIFWNRVRQKIVTFLEKQASAWSIPFFAKRGKELELKGFTILKAFADPLQALGTVIGTQTLDKLLTYVPIYLLFSN